MHKVAAVACAVLAFAAFAAYVISTTSAPTASVVPPTSFAFAKLAISNMGNTASFGTVLTVKISHDLGTIWPILLRSLLMGF